MTTPEPIDLDALEALREAGTPGPWKMWDGWGPTSDGLMGFARLGPDSGERVLVHDSQRDLYATRADAELIAQAVNALPELITEVRRLTDEVVLRDNQIHMLRTTNEFLAKQQSIMRRERDYDSVRADKAEVERDRLTETVARVEELANEYGGKYARRNTAALISPADVLSALDEPKPYGDTTNEGAT